MTPKEYLRQAYRLENEIKHERDNLESIRAMLTSIRSPGFEEHFNPNRNTDATFVTLLEKAYATEDRIGKKLIRLLDLRNEIRDTIDAVEDTDERLVLIYRYLDNASWSDIGAYMSADPSTVRRWHGKALLHIKIPKVEQV